MKRKLALVNGRIYTMDGKIAEAVITLGEKILKVDSTQNIKYLCDLDTEIIDLKGKAVLPGFNDSHMHLLMYGAQKDAVNLEGAGSIDEIIHRGKLFIKENNKKAGQWITGAGWNQNLFEGGKFPTRYDLDKISATNPIVFDRICTHVLAVNSLALKIVGLTSETYIPGGIIDKDSDGNLTGVLREAAVDWFKSRMPKRDYGEAKRLLKSAVSDALKVGLTSVHSSDINQISFEELHKAYTELKDNGELPIRINEQLLFPEKKLLVDFLSKGLRTGDGDNYFKIGPIKLLTDGSLGARTAALKEPYSDDINNSGLLTYEKEELDDIVYTAHSAGMQLFLHAIGDAAIEECIDSIEKAMAKSPRAARHRINHFQIGSKELFEKTARLGILADIQPVFVSSDWSMVENRIGEKRAKESYAWKTMMDLGIPLAGGSDCPIESFNPLCGIYAAATRKDLSGNPEHGWKPEQKLSVEAAVKLFTVAPAYFSFEEDIKGTISENKLADMVILSEDPFEIHTDGIKDIKVIATIVGGKIYE